MKRAIKMNANRIYKRQSRSRNKQVALYLDKNYISDMNPPYPDNNYPFNDSNAPC